jgi:hypothetical protein
MAFSKYDRDTQIDSQTVAGFHEENSLTSPLLRPGISRIFPHVPSVMALSQLAQYDRDA